MQTHLRVLPSLSIGNRTIECWTEEGISDIEALQINFRREHAMELPIRHAQSLTSGKKALDVVLCEPRTPGHLTKCEWSKIEQYCDALQVFKDATMIMTRENEPTLCRYMPSIYGIRKTLTSPVQSDDTNSSHFRQNLLEELNVRFNFINDSEPLILAMILDPRTKDRLLSGDEELAAHRVLHSACDQVPRCNRCECGHATWGCANVKPNVRWVWNSNKIMWYCVQCYVIYFVSMTEPAPGQSGSLMDFLDNIGRNEVK